MARPLRPTLFALRRSPAAASVCAEHCVLDPPDVDRSSDRFDGARGIPTASPAFDAIPSRHGRPPSACRIASATRVLGPSPASTWASDARCEAPVRFGDRDVANHATDRFDPTPFGVGSVPGSSPGQTATSLEPAPRGEPSVHPVPPNEASRPDAASLVLDESVTEVCHDHADDDGDGRIDDAADPPRATPPRA